MQPETLNKCMKILGKLKSSDAWDEDTQDFYSLFLCPLDDEIALKTAMYCATSPLSSDAESLRFAGWRPEPAQFLTIAAKLASPFPDSTLTYQEIMYLVERVGEHGAVDPKNPNVRLPGAPSFSHPLVLQVSLALGGWRMICSGEANFSGGLTGQVENAHRRLSFAWVEAVKQEIQLPPMARDKTLFPCYVPFKPDAGYLGQTERVQLPQVKQKAIEPSKEAAKLSRLLPSMSSHPVVGIPVRYEPLGKDKRKEIEEEIKVHFAGKKTHE